uniref:Type-4 uracil-DNA glycosylase n=1 Tax=candidate division WOR-3 bacterium TaxID=2052148 RepID=A0A7C2PF22_UNCW3
MKDPRVLIWREVLGFDRVWLPDSNKKLKLFLLEQQASKCKKCPLFRTREKFVFGWGNPYSGIMAVGEAPGPDEDKLGKPFVGRAGEFLNYALKEAGIDRERDLYIANVLKCIPVELATGTNGNPVALLNKYGKKSFRAPNKAEIAACSEWLESQISIIKPRFILAMGNPSVRYFLGDKVNITAVLGTPRKIRDGSITVFPVLHPSYIIRKKNPDLEKLYIQQLKNFKELVSELIPD